MAEIQCFWLEDTGNKGLGLRRFTLSDEKLCAASPGGKGGHDSWYQVCGPNGLHYSPPEGVQGVIDGHDLAKYGQEFLGRPEWPTHCRCGYAFAEDDRRQVWFDTVYRRSDTHRLVMLRDAPVGAMWHAQWYRELAERSQEAGQTKPTFCVHPDGRCLMVRTPGGDWCVDQRSSQGGYWRREGVPPYVTAHPSIALGDPERYHGWLRGGILVDV